MTEYFQHLKPPKSAVRQSKSASAIERQNAALPFSTQQQVIQLQRLIGNRATQQMIQRLPSSELVKSGITPKERRKHLSILGSAKKLRKKIVVAMKKYHAFLKTNKPTAKSLAALMDIYESIDLACQAYAENLATRKEDTDTEKIIAYVGQLRAEVQAERALAKIVTSFSFDVGAEETWEIALGQVRKYKPIPDEDITTSAAGGTNELEMVGEGGEAGFFKENIPQILNFEVLFARYGSEGVHKILKKLGMPIKGNMALSNLESSAVNAGIIKNASDEEAMWSTERQDRSINQHGYTQPADLAKRDVATSRLNELLGAGVIARADLALRRTGHDGELKMGSLMQKAQGATVNELMATQPSFNLQDPNLQRLLSRLQLVDTLAFQIDRNLSNFYILTDEGGQVIAVTGIDNDMAFGQYGPALDIKGKSALYPGLSRFVDAELAHRILALDNDSLNGVFADLLQPAEIAALIIRLDQLKAHLRELESQGLLLKEHQWDHASARGMLEEQSNYFAEMVIRMRGREEEKEKEKGDEEEEEEGKGKEKEQEEEKEQGKEKEEEETQQNIWKRATYKRRSGAFNG